MTTGTKILISTIAGIGIISLFAFRKKVVPAVKKVGKLFIADSSTTTADDGILKKGSTDEQHIEQLQAALNEIHNAAKYITASCNVWWPINAAGILQENGVFDDRTATACQFYLNRKEVDLDYLNDIRNKLSAYRAGDKCKYPLSY